MNDYQPTTTNPNPSGMSMKADMHWSSMVYFPAECAWMLQQAVESTHVPIHDTSVIDQGTKNLEGLAKFLPAVPPSDSIDHSDEAHDVSPNPWKVAALNGGSKEAYTNTNLRNSSRIILDSHSMAAWIFDRLKPYIKKIEVRKGANMHHSVNREEWKRVRDGILAGTMQQSGKKGGSQPRGSTTNADSERDPPAHNSGGSSNFSLGARMGLAEPGHTVNVKGKLARIRKNLLNGAPTDSLASSVEPIPSGVAPSAVLTRVNERLRFLKYTPGQYFSPHFDGCYFTGDKAEMSYATLQIYLNGPVGAEDDSEVSGFDFVDPELTPHQSNQLKGGATRFFSHRALLKGKDGALGGAYYDVEPRMGRVLLFEQDGLIHSGEEVTAGVKYTLRTEFMYKLEG